MPRSLRVAPKHLDRARFAVLKQGYCSQKMLAEEINLSRTTVNKFLNGHPILVINFYELCKYLNLSWEEIADLDIN